MEEFTKISIDLALSTKIKNYDRLVSEGESKMKTCVFYDGGSCIKFRSNSKILAVWKNDTKITPHALFCYLCPFYAFRDDGDRISLTMYDLYLFYMELRARIEREAVKLEERLNDVTFASSVFIRKRYNELLDILNDAEDKIDIIKAILSITKGM